MSTLLALILGLGVHTDARAADVPETPAIEVAVNDGYHPDRIVVPEGRRVVLKFLRTEYTGCTSEVVFPTLDVRRALPPGEPVVIDLGTPARGEVPFHCGMKMIHGVVVVEPKEQR
jgi:plastocyanin domain-containing protein